MFDVGRMITSAKDLCTRAILGDASIPQDIKDHLDQLSEVEMHRVDQTYLDFLSEQIILNARGDAWTERLRRRREDLEQQIGSSLLRCALRIGQEYSTFEIHPRKREVVHWEHYRE